MGSRRLGVRRLNALSKKGQSVTGSMGNGVSGSIGHRMIRRIGQEIITEIYVDLASSKGVLYQAGTTGTIIGHSSSAAGAQSAGKANLTQVTTPENGIVTLVEVTCVEAPTGGDADIDLVFAATEQVYSGSTSLTSIIAAGGNLVLGSENATLYDANELEDKYLYFSNGAATDGAVATAYTAGKLILRLYGHAVPDDVQVGILNVQIKNFETLDFSKKGCQSSGASKEKGARQTPRESNKKENY